jgi:hypothetical protein
VDASLPLQEPTKLNQIQRQLYRSYNKYHDDFIKRGLYLGRTPLALLTQNHGSRKAYSYKNMDYYTDYGHSAWRPWMTVDELKGKSNFSYMAGRLVLTFKEERNSILVKTRNTLTKQTEDFRCHKLILASSAMGTARIVLRSADDFTTRLPLLSNPYTYVPCIVPKMFGGGSEEGKVEFAQLSAFIDQLGNKQNYSVASFYAYQSLMLYRIVDQLPFGLRDSRNLLRYLLPGLLIMGIQHPDSPTANKFVSLKKISGTASTDLLNIVYRFTEAEMVEHSRREKQFTKFARQLGTFPTKRIHSPNGSSIHYAGTLPFSEKERKYALRPDGSLWGHRRVYVADSSGFKYLPGPGLTFSLMANAHKVAEASLA